MVYEDRALDALAAEVIDGWRDIREEHVGKTSDVRGSPPEGLRRPIIRYSRDMGRAMHLARKAAKLTVKPIVISIDHDTVSVTCDGRQESASVTSHLAAMLVRASVRLVTEWRAKWQSNAARRKER